MKVKVIVFAQLREKLGWSERHVELSGNDVSLKEVFAVLPELSKYVLKGDDLREDVIVLVNGINVRFTGGLNAKVNDGAEIAIFPPGGGG